LADCDIERTTAYSLIAPAISVQDGLTVAAPGGAQLQAAPIQIDPSGAGVKEICR